MQTHFEHLAATSLLGSGEAPPRDNSNLRFDAEWERRAFGLAVAVSKEGHYEWEEFRRLLIDEIARWEACHARDDPSWDYYERWLGALERVLVSGGLVDPVALERRARAVLDGCHDSPDTGA